MHIIDIYRSNQYRRLASCEQGCPSKSAIRENQHRYWAAARYEDSLARNLLYQWKCPAVPVVVHPNKSVVEVGWVLQVGV